MTTKTLKIKQLSRCKSVQVRPGVYIDSLFDIFRFPFDRAVTNFKKGTSTKIEVTLGKEAITIQDNSVMNEDYFKNDMAYLFDPDKSSFLYQLSEENEIKPYRYCFFNYMFVVNALSKKFTVAYKNGDNEYYCRFKNQKLKQRKDNVVLQDGFMTKFKIDMSRFVHYEDDLLTRELWLEKLKEHLLHTAKLNEGLSITFNDTVNETTELFHFKSSTNSIFSEKFGSVNKDKQTLISGKDESENPLYFSIAYETDHEGEFDFISYVNDVEVVEGGVHIRELKRFLVEQKGLSENLDGVKVVFILNMYNPEFNLSGKSLINRSLKNRMYKLLQ